jgi:hypothetical protein
MNTLSKNQVGTSGEYFVAAELSRHGYVASLTLRNTRGIDVQVSNADATRSVAIQVKTCRGLTPKWLLNAKAEADSAENLFYVFVCLPDRGMPSFYIVPPSTVAKQVSEDHRQWLAKPRRDGRPHPPDTSTRNFRASAEDQDRWDLLGLA